MKVKVQYPVDSVCNLSPLIIKNYYSGALVEGKEK